MSPTARVIQQIREDERAKIVAWLRSTPRAGGVPISIASSQDVARLADAIEAGEHVPSDSPGTPPSGKVEPC